jgi:hypothetical protein
MKITRLISLLPLCSVAVAVFAQQPAVVRYHASIDTVKYLFGPASPVARLRPGDILETNTLDCFGNAIQKPPRKP